MAHKFQAVSCSTPPPPPPPPHTHPSLPRPKRAEWSQASTWGLLRGLQSRFQVKFQLLWKQENGFSFDDARLCLNGKFWQSNFKRFKFNILVSFRDLSLMKSRMGEGEFSLFDTFSFWPPKKITIFNDPQTWLPPPQINKVFEPNS